MPGLPRRPPRPGAPAAPTPPPPGGSAASVARTVTPDYDGYVSSQGGSDTFVFSRHPGDVTVSDFVAAGSGHDTLSFSPSTFNSVAAVLRHTTAGTGETVIHLSKTDMVELVGVTKAELRSNPSDFSFHA